MATLVEKPAIIQAAGTPPKRIEEFVGRVNSNTDVISIARMRSPGGWKEPGQTAAFDEYSVVLKGTLHLHLCDGDIDVHAGQAATVHAGEWVQYSTPSPEGAEYIAVCLPAFSPDTVKRDEA
jgi:mannose-6-phosphate isomerase-like protein (cupin superfamily)